MLSEKLNIRMDSVFSDDKKHRFLLRRSWGRDGKIATVIMINPNSSECLITDMTSVSVYNGIARLGGFAALNIVNLYSLITSKISFKWNSDEELNLPENDKNIVKAVGESDITILAWGTIADNNSRVKKRVSDVLHSIEAYKDKLYVIEYGDKEGLHPLCPQLRNNIWGLKNIDYEAFIKSVDEVKGDNNEIKPE